MAHITTNIKNVYDATSAPTVDDDETQGYSNGSLYLYPEVRKLFFCSDPETGSAVWKLISSDGEVVNKTGDQLDGGEVVRITGSQGSVVTVDKAKADAESTSASTYGILLENTPDNAKGFVVTSGTLSSVDTSGFSEGNVLWLSATTAGAITSSKPASPNHAVKVGIAKNIHATQGSIEVGIANGWETYELHDVSDTPPSTGEFLYHDGSIYNPTNFEAAAMGEFGAETREPTGFVNRTTTTLSFTDGTRTASIQPTDANFTYWERGVKYTSTGDTLVISDVNGSHYLYYDGDTLTETVNPSILTLEEIYEENPLVVAVYWNVSAAEGIYVGDERHGTQMDGATHARIHFDKKLGTAFFDGLALGDILEDEDGSLDTHAQLSASEGIIEDEDLVHSIASKTAPANINIAYKTGASGIWAKDTATDFVCKRFGAGRLAYNQFTGGAWQQTEVTDGRYVLVHLVADNDISDNWFAVQGQNEYSTLGLARTGAEQEVNTMRLAGLNSPEILFVGTVIFQTKDTYSNTVKARIRSTEAGDPYIDLRQTGATPGGGGGGIESLLEDPSPQLGGDLDANGQTITSLDASLTARGIVELATSAEIDTGTDSARAIPIDQLVASKRNIRFLVFNCVDPGTDVATGTNIYGDFICPISGTILQDDSTKQWLMASNSTAGTTGTMVIDIHLNGTTIMDTNKLDIETGEKTTETATTQPGLTTTAISAGDIITIDEDAVHTTPAKGLSVIMAIRES